LTGQGQTSKYKREQCVDILSTEAKFSLLTFF
jgi:hypothetical protein